MKLLLTLHNNDTFFELFQYTAESQRIIESCIAEVCTFTKGSFFKNKFLKKTEYREKILRLSTLNTFPTGLLWNIHTALQTVLPELEIEIDDQRLHSENLDIPYKFQFELDRYQKEAIEAGLKTSRGFFHAATGAGKTAIMIALACNKGGKSLIIVPSIDLVNQISEDFFQATGIKSQKIRGLDSIPAYVESPFTIASISTLVQNLELINEFEWLFQFDNLFLDEAHHSGVSMGTKENGYLMSLNGYYRVANSCPAFNRYAFTATPGETELLIRALTGRKLYSISEDNLVSLGRLSTSYVFMMNMEHETYKEYEEAFKKCILENLKRNKMIVEILKRLEQKGLSTLIMLDSKQIQLQNLLEIEKFTVLTGSSKKAFREQIYDRLHKKEILSLITTVAKEGVNIKSVDCIFRVGAIKSTKRITQEKGRGVRIDIASGKDKVLILDFFDNDKFFTVREGAKFKTKRGFLRKQSDKRRLLYESTLSAEVRLVNSVEELFNQINKIWK